MTRCSAKTSKFKLSIEFDCIFGRSVFVSTAHLISIWKIQTNTLDLALHTIKTEKLAHSNARTHKNAHCNLWVDFYLHASANANW